MKKFAEDAHATNWVTKNMCDGVPFAAREFVIKNIWNERREDYGKHM